MAAKKTNAVTRACRLLKEAADIGLFSLAEMSRALDEPTSTVDRLLATLCDEGLIERQGAYYKLGHQAAKLWAAYNLGLRRTIQQAQAKLADVAIPTNHPAPAPAEAETVDAEFMEIANHG